MSGLTHQQAKQLINTAADRSLTLQDKAALDTHLSQCANCQAYVQEVNWLDGAIGRALRSKWSAPRRSPIDMAARVRHRMRTQTDRQLFLKAANVTVKLGSLALVVMLAVGGWRSHRVTNDTIAPANSAVNVRSGLPSFELESDSASSPKYIEGSVSDADNWQRPSLPLNRLHASQY